MAASAASQRLERIEKFLDNSDKIDTPRDLQEPFRSLFLRIRGEKPTLMSDERKQAVLTSGLSTGGLGDVQITSGGGDKGGIELISPKDVGPTVEMEVKKDKVTFKMAQDKDLKKVQAKEDAANQMISLQSTIKPIRGLGGEVAKVWEGITDIARDYKEGNYEKAIDLSKILEKKIRTEDFKKSIVVELQKKLKEYEDLGGNTAKARAKFKELAEALKEDADDLFLIAGDVNALAEASIRDLVADEVVAVKVDKKEEAPKPQRKVLKRKVVPELPKETGEEEEETGKEDQGEDEFEIDEDSLEGEDREEEEEKPVIKIVTVKKLVPVKKMKKERQEYEDSINKAEVEKAAEKKPLEKETEPRPEKKTPEKEVREAKPGKETPKKEEQKKPASDAIPKEKITEAFNKYQTAYKISLKMNEKGKDVSQIFDLMKFAEQAREKGDMKTYVGVCNQMESMVLKMQSQ